MNPGQMKHRITIQHYEEYEADNHISKQRWIDLSTVWCSMNDLFGKEYWRAKQYNAENTVEFIIRCNACKDIRVKDRINYKGRLFNITSIDNIKYENKYMKIKAMEVI